MLASSGAAPPLRAVTSPFEVDHSARAAAQLGLPVIEGQEDEVEPETDLVPVFDPGEVLARGPVLLDPLERLPAGRAEIRVASPRSDVGKAFLPRVVAADTGDAQVEVLAVIERPHLLILAPETDDAVVEERRREGVGVADGEQIHLRVGVARAAAGRRAARFAEDRRARDRRQHVGVLAPDTVFLAVVVVDLGVDLLAGEGRRAGGVVVGDRARLVGLRVVVLHPPRDHALPAHGNSCVVERHAVRCEGGVGGVLNARQGIVDRHAGVAEVAGAVLGRRHRVPGADAGHALRGLVVAEEVEQLVTHDRAAQGAAEVVVVADRLDRREEVARAQALVVMKPERRAVQLVRSRFGDDRSRRAAGQPLLGFARAGGDIDRLDRVGRGNVAGMMRQPDVDAGRAVDARHVVVAVGAVDVRAERARGRIENGVLKTRRRRAGHQVDQSLVIAEAGQRQLAHGRRRDLRAGAGLFGLQAGGRGLDGDLLGHLTDLHARVDAGDGVHRHRDALGNKRAESFGADGHVVASGLHVDEAVNTVFGCRPFLACAGGRVHDGDRRAGNRRAAFIGDGTDNRPVENLRVGCRNKGRRQAKQDGRQTPKTIFSEVHESFP